jgi:hypothetical protein
MCRITRAAAVIPLMDLAFVAQVAEHTQMIVRPGCQQGQDVMAS